MVGDSIRGDGCDRRPSSYMSLADVMMSKVSSGIGSTSCGEPFLNGRLPAVHSTTTCRCRPIPVRNIITDDIVKNVSWRVRSSHGYHS